MADYFITATASGGGLGTVGDPFTLLEAASHSQSNNGNFYYIKKGNYNLPNNTQVTLNGGGFGTPNIFTGYNTDLDDGFLGFGSNSEIIVDNMPRITGTGVLITVGQGGMLSCVDFETSRTIRVCAVSNAYITHSKIKNTNTSSQAGGARLQTSWTSAAPGDRGGHLIRCQVESSGTVDLGAAVNIETAGRVYGCVLRNNSNTSGRAIVFSGETAELINSTILGSPSHGILIGTGSSGSIISNNTIINCDSTCIRVTSNIARCLTLSSNIFANSGRVYDAAGASQAHINIMNNNVKIEITALDNNAGPAADNYTTGGSLATEFLDFNNNDLRLRPNSVSSGAGLGGSPAGAAIVVYPTPAEIAEAVWTRTGRTLTG